VQARLTPALGRDSGHYLGRRSAPHAALGVALVAAWVTTAAIASAQLNLQWEAPPGCPQGSEVLGRIRALAGSSLDETAVLSAEGRIALLDGRYQLTLLVRDGSDVRKRVMTSDSCADLAGAAAIALALLLGADVGAAESWADNDTPGEQAPKEGAPDRREPSSGRSDDIPGEQHDARGGDERGEPRDDRAERIRLQAESSAAADGWPSTRRWAVVLRAPSGAAEVGPLPGATLGVGLAVGIRYQAWRVLLAGHVFQARTISATEPGSAFGAGASLQRMTGQLSTCRGWRSRRFEVAPCIGLALEYLTARGFGQGVSSESRSVVWPAPSAGAVAHWYAFDYLALFVGLTGYLELSRPRLVIEGIGEVGQLAPAAAGAIVGIEWIL
jgi:hypothetical protein